MLASTNRRPLQGGLSLIEVLVGIAVGMIGILVIFQTIAVWDKHTQTTGSGGDARTAGTLAMFNLDRDVKLAGMGFATADNTVMGCSVKVKDNSFDFPLSPVKISSAPDGTAIIDVLHGSSSFFVTTETFTDSTATTKKLKRRGGFKAGDLAVVAGNATPASAASSTCVLVEISDASDVDGLTVAHLPGNYVSFYTPASGASQAASFNTAAGTGAGVFTSGTIYNLGPRPLSNRWAINNGSLVYADKIHGTDVFQVAEGVVDMRAQYGVDTNLDKQIDDTEWTVTEPTDWTKVLAIRVGLLVRSRQFEKKGDTPYTAAGASSPSWSGNALTPFVMRNVDGSSDSFGPTDVDPNNWRYYRYRVYERVIPLRNMVWSAS